MIQTLLKNPMVLHQKPDDDIGVPEPAIAGCTDTSGLILLSQEGREILLNRSSVEEFVRMVRKLKVSGAVDAS